VRGIYITGMVDELAFRRESDASLELLKQSLVKADADGDFEAEGQNGALSILFERLAANL
jgi:frataxin-like iron-binding protein CyaY